MPKIELIQRNSGLSLQADTLEAPEGSMSRARNVLCRRYGLVESRRGLNRYGAVATAEIRGLFEYRDRIQRQFGTTLDYDSDGAGAWTTYTGSFSPPANRRMLQLEVRRENYLTTSLGVFSQDSLTADPVRAGMPKCLDVRPSTTGTGGGFFLGDSRVAYRGVWLRTNAVEREKRGAPSTENAELTNAFQSATYTSVTTTITVTLASHGFSNGDTVVVRNGSDSVLDGSYTISNVAASTFDYTASGDPTPDSGTLEVTKAYDASVVVPIPDDVVAGDVLELYRTALSAGSASAVVQEYFLLMSHTVVAGDLTAGEITLSDDLPAVFLGVRLYTNPSQSTRARANDRPPWAEDMALFEGHVIYSNTRREHEREAQFRDVAGVVAGTDTITIVDDTDSETYTFETAEDVVASEFQLYTALPTRAENVEETMRSFVYVVNRASSVWYAFYISLETDAPGRVLVMRRDLVDRRFDLRATAGAGGNFLPTLPTSGSAVHSRAPGGQNELAVSKFEEPEAVPRLSREPVGSEDDAVERIWALREAVLVFKRNDGMFSLSGQTDGGPGAAFAIREADSSVRIRGRYTLAELENSALLFSTQGFVAVTRGQTQVLGARLADDSPISDRMQEHLSFSNFENAAHAFAYESEHLYVCMVPATSTETTPTQSYVYCDATGLMTEAYQKDISAGVVLSADERLYVAHGTDDFVLQERKAFSAVGGDYIDEDIAVTVTAVSTTIYQGATVSLVTLAYAYTGMTLSRGFLFTQGSVFSKVMVVEDLGAGSFRLTLQELLPGLTAAAATLSLPIDVSIRWNPVFGRQLAMLKQWTGVHLDQEEDAAFDHTLGFASDIVGSIETPSTPFATGAGSLGWGSSSWGSAPWGDSALRTRTPLVVVVPDNYARARQLVVTYDHMMARERVALSQIAIQYREIGMRTARRAAI